jgi:arylsulfatase A-like enzyme
MMVALALLMVVTQGRAQSRAPSHPASPRVRNVILFIADGLRHDAVNATDAPTLFALRSQGVELANSHALFPTLTTLNAAAIATGHSPGDTGDFSNAEYIGFQIFDHGGFGRGAETPVPFLESDPVLADLNTHYAGNFLQESSLLAIARAHGFSTAAIGKLGPVAIQDVSQLVPSAGTFATPETVIIDDSTGNSSAGVPVPPAVESALRAAGLMPSPPARGQSSGSVDSPGTLKPNRDQQKWFADVATQVVLPAFVAAAKPFVLVFWSRDPDGTQHNQGDSLNSLTPGINGSTTRAAVANADANLKQLLDFVQANPDLASTTDIIVTSDHGFATISKHVIDAEGHVTHSYAARQTYRDRQGRLVVKEGWLPPCFLAIDIAHELGEPLFDPDSPVRTDVGMRFERVDPTRPPASGALQLPATGNALIIGGTGSLQDARVLVASNGGSDLIYIQRADRALVRRVAEFLIQQDYIGGIFADSRFGTIPGALPLSAIGLEGRSRMPRPALVVTFKSFLQVPGNLLSAVQIADTPLQEGQGMHGSLTRDNTFNNMAAIGPSFRKGFVDPLPAGNADIAPTLAHILGLTLPSHGKLKGRVLYEALMGTQPSRAEVRRRTLVSPRTSTGQATRLEYQQLGGQRYLDAAELR